MNYLNTPLFMEGGMYPNKHDGRLHARFLYQDASMGEDASISLFRLFLALLCPLSIVLLSWHLNLEISRKILISITRTIVQLLLAGYVLLSFIFSMNSPIYVLIYLVLMMLVAAVEATSRQIRTYPGHFLDSLCAVVMGGGFVGAFGAIVIFNPNPWWEPHVMVPTAGMIIGNSISGPAVAVDRLLADVAEKKHESETRLAFGATMNESILPAMRSAILAALIPNLNMMSVVGLVSIPGMMTGQLLGGATPLVAAEYQMAILWLICATTSISTYVGASLAMTHAAFDKEHRLTSNKIVKRAEGKVNIEIALLMSIKSLIINTGTTIMDIVTTCHSKASRLFSSEAEGDAEYDMVPASAHGFLPSEEDDDVTIILSNSSDNTDSSHSSNNSLNGLNTLNSSPKSTAKLSLSSKLSSSSFPRSSPRSSPRSPRRGLHQSKIPDNFVVDEGKVSYTLDVNIPQGHADLERALSPNAFFQADGVNVLSGESLLFGPDGLMLMLRRGERVSVEGPSGLGKTRLLRAIAQLDAPFGGTVTIIEDDESSLTLVAKDLTMPNWRRRVIYVPQAVPPMTGSPKDLVREACQYTVRRQGAGSIETLKDLDGKCVTMEASLGLSSGKLSDTWSSLSGGERQRAAIGCALLLAATVSADDGGNSSPRSASYGSPAVLLLDEPTAACDSTACAAVERAVISSGLAVLIITHDHDQAQRLAHKRLIMTSL